VRVVTEKRPPAGGMIWRRRFLHSQRFYNSQGSSSAHLVRT
jgi:hypothetical protein